MTLLVAAAMFAALAVIGAAALAYYTVADRLENRHR